MAPVAKSYTNPSSTCLFPPFNFSFDPRQNQDANSGENFEQDTREWAATRINAAARGFLVRRLFGTEQVQRIVQTIRDTLIFVLNLHLETCGNGQDAKETANLRLKARLLQQVGFFPMWLL